MIPSTIIGNVIGGPNDGGQMRFEGTLDRDMTPEQLIGSQLECENGDIYKMSAFDSDSRIFTLVYERKAD